jgi:outer membrane protein assembly factor BamB
VFALGSWGDLIAVDAKTGKEEWRVSLPDLGGEVPGWGYSESPLADRERLLVTPGGKKGTLAALDPATGKVLWRSDQLTDPAMCSSVAATDVDGQRQYVVVTREHVSGVTADGKLAWQVEFKSRVVVAQSPVVAGSRVYVTASGGTGSRGFKLTATGVEKGFANKVLCNLPGGVAVVGGRVFGYSDGAGWVCQDFNTGEETWSDKSFPKGTLTAADGHLILVSEEKGRVALVSATADGFGVASEFTLTPQ